jgi:hypothetical protein
MLFAEKWIELEIIMVSEINQAQKEKYCIIFCLYGKFSSKKDSNITWF